jgi:hypothetical protein
MVWWNGKVISLDQNLKWLYANSLTQSRGRRSRNHLDQCYRKKYYESYSYDILISSIYKLLDFHLYSIFSSTWFFPCSKIINKNTHFVCIKFSLYSQYFWDRMKNNYEILYEFLVPVKIDQRKRLWFQKPIYFSSTHYEKI